MKTFKRAALAAALVTGLLVGGGAHAQWAVIDGASISTQIRNQVETLAQWTQQFKQLQAQLNQGRAQLDAITGSRGMGALLDNQAVKAMLPADFNQMVSTIKNTAAYATERAKYPTLVGMPKTNSMYDAMAAQRATMSDLYAKASGRMNQVQDLMGQIDSAGDPAAKQDLANRLISEQNQIEATANLAQMLQAKQRQELEDAAQQARKELTCKEFKRASCL